MSFGPLAHCLSSLSLKLLITRKSTNLENFAINCKLCLDKTRKTLVFERHFAVNYLLV